MKTQINPLTHLITIVIFLCMPWYTLAEENPLVGLWEGMFMEQFRVEIHITADDHDNFPGRIRMYDGSLMIQDDTLASIKLDSDTLSFLIPAKETWFEGRVLTEQKEVQGNFIFPDGSFHPVLFVKKFDPSSQSSNVNIAIDSRQTVDTIESGKTEAVNLQHATDPAVPRREYDVAELREDLFYLKEQLSIHHPQYHLYTSEETYDDMYASILQQLDNNVTMGEFFTLIAPVVARVGCSHTGIRLPETYCIAQRGYGHYFPLKVMVTGSRMWVSQTSSGSEPIEAGAEILSINEVPVSSILSELLTFIPSEGNNSTTKFYALNKDFQYYFQLMYGSEYFNVRFIHPGDEQPSSISLQAVLYDYIAGQDKKNVSSWPVWSFPDQYPEVAVLKVPTFALTDINRYLEETDSIFSGINQADVKNLVIDLRGNDGGHPIFAAILFSYLVDEDFTWFRENKDVPDFKPLYQPMQAANNNFKGNCYVLVDGGCLSTTGHLISLLKYHERAVFIGEEPGSWFYCNDNSFQVCLPNTDIEVNIPRSTFITAVEGYTLGDPFMVDYPVQESIKDKLDGRDPCLEYAYFLINKSEPYTH